MINDADLAPFARTYDAFQYGHYHSIFMNTFILSVAVSGLLQTIEVEHLWHEQYVPFSRSSSRTDPSGS